MGKVISEPEPTTVLIVPAVICAGLLFLAWRNWHYSRVFSVFYGTQRNIVALWQPGMSFHVVAGRIADSVWMVLSLHDPPMFSWKGVPVLIGALVAPLAALGGLFIAAGVFFLFSKIFHATQSSSEGRVAELFGHSATVITPIAPGGVGEIAYVQGGTRYTASARTDEDRPVASGEKVRNSSASASVAFSSAASGTHSVAMPHS